MCQKVKEPLLFIETPNFVDVGETDKVEIFKAEIVEDVIQTVIADETLDEEIVKESQVFEESTSVYELSRAERIKDPVIARQLNYFLQPINKERLLVLHLYNGDEVIGKITELIGLDVKLTMNDQELFINANDIRTITTKKSL